MIFRNKKKLISKLFILVACIFAALSIMPIISGCDFELYLPSAPTVEDKVTINPSSAEIAVGGTITVTAISSEGRSFSWTSDDEDIATVDDEGLVTGISAGVTTIYANDGKKIATCKITVTSGNSPDGGNNEQDENQNGEENNNSGVTLNSTKITLYEGDSITLTVKTVDQSDVTWSTNNAEVATVVRGRVTAVGVGTANITATSVTAGSATCKVTVNSTAADLSGYELVWSDEFDVNSLDMTKWGYQVGRQDQYGSSTGPWDWGNSELQYYTDGANLKVTDGALQITAKRESMRGQSFTSSRITTRDKFTVTYGLIEAKMKTPAIEGMWPAFWMLPNPSNTSSSDNDYGGWPASGELDIMEAKGRLVNKVDTTIHFGGPDWNNHQYKGGTTTLTSSTEEWHTYAVEWTSQYIAWIIDGKEVCRVNNSDYWSSATADPSAPFNKPYYILLNLAVGGQYDSYREPPASFTQATMYVDYVRVYQKKG